MENGKINIPLRHCTAWPIERHKLGDVPTFSVNVLLTARILRRAVTIAEINGADPMKPRQFATTLARAPQPVKLKITSEFKITGGGFECGTTINQSKDCVS